MSLSVAVVDYTHINGPTGEAYDFAQWLVSKVIDNDIELWRIMDEGHVIIEITVSELMNQAKTWKSLKAKSESDYQKVEDFIEDIDNAKGSEQIVLHFAL